METNIMELDVKNLANKQYEYLKDRTILILNNIINDLKEDKLQEIQDKLEFSADGDGWGNTNWYINFSYIENEPMDLHDILYKMAQLKNKKINTDKSY